MVPAGCIMTSASGWNVSGSLCVCVWLCVWLCIGGWSNRERERGHTHTERERKRALLFAGSLLRWPQGGRITVQSFHLGDRGPRTGAISTALSRPSLESWIRSTAAGTQIGAHTRCSFIHHAPTLASRVFLYTSQNSPDKLATNATSFSGHSLLIFARICFLFYFYKLLFITFVYNFCLF